MYFYFLGHELFACKERQKMEIEAQNQTLEEQRNHIAMLEKALANSQERLAKREKVCLRLVHSTTSSSFFSRNAMSCQLWFRMPTS